MRQLSPLTFLLVVLALLGVGFFLLHNQKQAMPSAPANANHSAKPDFDMYPVAEQYKGPIAAPDFSSNPRTREFRTRITEAMKQGVNFAGHYVIAEWGCGTSCQSHAIIDAKTGKIIEFGLLSAYGVRYKFNSSLLIVNPAELVSSGETYETVDYYTFNNNTLQFLVKFFPGEDQPRFCIQVITPARNPFTGEEKEFSDPCHVPYGWQVKNSFSSGIPLSKCLTKLIDHV